MQNKRKFVEEGTVEDYLHRDVWRVVNRQLEYAKTNRTGALYDDLVAMVFSYHALEGYLNFVGAKLAPDLWKDEKKEFSDTGIAGKLTAICDFCGIDVFEKSRRPYSTVIALKKLRDSMAHPKTQKTNHRKEFVEGKTLPLFRPSYLAQLVSHQKAMRAHDDVRTIAARIYSAALSRFPNVHIGDDPFEGMISMNSATTRLA